jgi:hypothetical protein
VANFKLTQYPTKSVQIGEDWRMKRSIFLYITATHIDPNPDLLQDAHSCQRVARRPSAGLLGG